MSEQMTDSQGAPLSVGAICIYMPADGDKDTRGKKAIVRAVKPPQKIVFASGPRKGQFIPDSYGSTWRARIDDDVTRDDDADEFSFSAWVESGELVVIGEKEKK